MKLRKLFSPITINGLEIRNRISMPSMGMHYGSGGQVTEKLIRFYAARAEGGTGLIIHGPLAIDRLGGGTFLVGLHEEKFEAGHLRFTAALREHGARSCAQLMHAGKYLPSFVIGDTAVSASAVRSKLTGEIPRELSREEIKGLVAAYVAAADRARRWGYDAVEVLACTGYLICQFLSPVTNVRTDEYGGSLENRARFGCEVIAAVREKVGKDYPLIVRVAGADFVQGGHTNVESQIVCSLFKDAGVDAINVTGGWHETKVPQITMGVPRGAYLYLAARIREAVGLPVIASNRLSDPLVMEKALREGMADMVNLGRPLIADPDLPNKAREGRFDEIRMCIACNQGCFDNAVKARPVSCMVNPMAGREHVTKIEPAKKKKKVVVVGGGPAGLEAAALAAQRGHEVVLFERSEELGGQLRLAGAPPDRTEFLELAGYLERAAVKAGVRIETGREATVDLLNGEKPDVVVVASGARQIVPDLPGMNRPNVVMAWDLLLGEAELGERVVIVGGGAVGVETAVLAAHVGTVDAETLRFLVENDAEDWPTLESLVKKGTKNVTLVEMLDKIGKDIGRTTRWTALLDLERHGVKMLTGAKALAIGEAGVVIERDGREEVVPADTVVIALGSRKDNELYEEIRDRFPKVLLVGDAKRPRKAYEAIHEGFEAGLRL